MERLFIALATGLMFTGSAKIHALAAELAAGSSQLECNNTAN